DESYLKNLVEQYHIGAARYNGASKIEIYNQNKTLQENSKIPLLIACNAEGGGDGACNDGTKIGMPVKIGATNDSHNAYLMGKVSGIEAEAVGCNWTFAPIVDINSNWRNPIISCRCFSNNADEVLEYAKEYYRGVTENSHLICAMKHFPGDGIDERDQHLSNSINSLSCEEWDKTYGKVYKGMIDFGIQAVMVGHIMQPSYTRKFNPTLTDEDIMPGTLSKELVTDLLKGQLKFNGLVVTDASHMVGLTCAKKRSEVVPGAIAAGCDLFLFFNDMDEDFNYMLDGYKNGVFTEERLYDALRRILGTKASMGLHKKNKNELVPKIENLSIIGSNEHKKIEKDVADKSITLLKNKDNIFPLSVEKTPRILIVPAKALSGSNFFNLMFSDTKKLTPEEILRNSLEKEGFKVEIYESPIEKIGNMSSADKKASID
ncbi:MAG: glycoside hydrolase family 3 N-terminal domain-containing protein, partial [Clostridia bacterium]